MKHPSFYNRVAIFRSFIASVLLEEEKSSIRSNFAMQALNRFNAVYTAWDDFWLKRVERALWEMIK